MKENMERTEKMKEIGKEIEKKALVCLGNKDD